MGLNRNDLKENLNRIGSVKVRMLRGKHYFQSSFNLLKEWVCSLEWECSWQKMLTVHPLISLIKCFPNNEESEGTWDCEESYVKNVEMQMSGIFGSAI